MAKERIPNGRYTKEFREEAVKLITEGGATVRMARNRSIDIPVSLYNYGGGTLTGLRLTTETGPGITAGVINSGDDILTSGERQNIILRVTSLSNAPDSSYATMTAKVSEGLQKTLNANISIVQLIPVITTSPSYIDTGMVRGNQKIATFTITNTGEEVLRNARIEGPSTLWMTLTINKALGDIQPGVSKTIGIMFSPPTTLSQGVYDDRIVIYSDNHIPYTYHIQVTVTSNAVGNVMFDVLNEFMEDVPNATITFQHQLLTELIYTLKTGTDGSVMQYDIPEGRYTYNVSPPPGHMPYSGTFIINPGLTTTVPIALEMTMVTVTWSVTPTTIQDKYEIVITQTFETNVPAPVLITEPPSITLPEMQPGQVFNGEFAVTNYGLIAVDNVNLNFPTSILDYDIEVLTSAIPKRINAMQKITVPYRITRRMQTAYFDLLNLKDAYALLLEEVKGYGGSSCLTSFNVTTCGEYVICPNTAQQRKGTRCTSYTVGVPQTCPSGTSGGYYTGGGGGGGSYSGVGGGGQGGGGYIPGSSPEPLKTGNPCNCKANCTPCSTPSIENGVCKEGTCVSLKDNPCYCKPNCTPCKTSSVAAGVCKNESCIPSKTCCTFTGGFGASDVIGVGVAIGDVAYICEDECDKKVSGNITYMCTCYGLQVSAGVSIGPFHCCSEKLDNLIGSGSSFSVISAGLDVGGSYTFGCGGIGGVGIGGGWGGGVSYCECVSQQGSTLP